MKTMKQIRDTLKNLNPKIDSVNFKGEQISARIGKFTMPIGNWHILARDDFKITEKTAKGEQS